MDNNFQSTIRLGQCLVHRVQGTIEGPNGVHHVPSKTMEVLMCLIDHPGEIVERNRIVKHVWGDKELQSDVLSHCISDLRHALGDHSDAPSYIQTLPKRGYRLIANVELSTNVEHIENEQPIDVSLWADLKRRKVVRTGIAYVAISWVILQVVDTLIPPLPEQTRPIILYLAIIGLPVALILAWAYDITLVRDKPGNFMHRVKEFVNKNANTLLVTASIIVAATTASFMLKSEDVFSFTPGSPVVFSFNNYTQDDSLGFALAQSFRIALEQSHHASVFSRKRTNDALVRMGVEPNASIDEKVAREIAIREGAKAIVAGSVSKVGDSYLILAEVINPANQSIIYSTSGKADTDGLLPVLEGVAGDIREHLGESLSSIKETSRPLVDVITPNLDALRAFSLGKEKTWDYETSAAIDLMREAIKLDPEFAMAHVELGGLLFGQSADKTPAYQHWEKALSFSDRLTHKEQLTTEAYNAMRSSTKEALRRWSLLTNLYPDHALSHRMIGMINWFQKNDFETAALSYSHAAEIDGLWYSYYQRAYCRLGEGRYEDALSDFKLAYDRAGHYNNYGIVDAYIASGQHKLAGEILEEFNDDQVANQNLNVYEKIVAYHVDRGEFKEASHQLDKLRQSLDVPSNSEELDHVMTRLALTRELDNKNDYLALLRSSIPTLSATIAIAKQNSTLPPLAELAFFGKLAVRAGLMAEAEELRDLLTGQDNLAEHPVWIGFLGILEGELSIAGGDNALAIEQLREAIKHGNLFQAHESLAFAYESDGQYEQAVEELNWLIEHRGQLFAEYLSDFFGREHSILDWVVAHFRLAQVSEKMGKPQIAVQNYKKLMQHWRQADAHIPIRQLAEQRLIELNGSDQISVSPGT